MDTVPVNAVSSRRTMPVSVGALVVTVLGAVAGVLLHSKAGPVMVLVLYWPTLASLAGMITAFLERRTRGAMICLWISQSSHRNLNRG
jgi:hypothetical protein